MNTDQCKARILAVLTHELNHATYENLCKQVGAYNPYHAFIFAKALKDLCLEKRVLRYPAEYPDDGKDYGIMYILYRLR